MGREAYLMVATIGTPTGVRRFFSNPVVGVIGTLASVVSLGLAIIFYLQGTGKRDLVYAVYPLRTYLARAERPSDLRVEFKGQLIRSADVIAVQVGFWNQGHLNIRPENVLEPLELVLRPPSAVLQASIIKPSRDVAGLKLSSDADLLKRGRMPLHFKILERGDGATVQLIYTGPRDTRVELSGIIEGQGVARNLSPPEASADESPLERYRSYRKKKTGDVVASGVLAVLFIGFAVYIVRNIRRDRPEKKRSRRILVSVVVLFSAAYVAFFGYSLWDWWVNPAPPFGF